MNTIMLGWFGTTEVIILLLVILLLFGGKKIPEMMRGIGKGIKEFRSGISEKEDTAKDDSKN